MPSLTSHQVSILEALVDAWLEQPEGRRQRLLHLEDWHDGGAFNTDRDMPAASRADLDDLDYFGLVDIEFTGSGEYLVRPSLEGIEKIRQYRRQVAQAEGAVALDLSWAAVRPIIHAVVDAWREAGAPHGGFVLVDSIAEAAGREPGSGLRRTVEILAEDGWFDVSYDEDDDALRATPTLKAVAATQGWPEGDGMAAVERMLGALEDLSANAPDEEKRRWAGRVRETFMEATSKTVAEVAAKMASGAV